MQAWQIIKRVCPNQGYFVCRRIQNSQTRKTRKLRKLCQLVVEQIQILQCSEPFKCQGVHDSELIELKEERPEAVFEACEAKEGHRA